MKVFYIHPVRSVAPGFLEKVRQHVERLEADGHQVYLPVRDTDQDDPTGYRICQDNRKAILDADMVYFAWDGQSQGCLFDLGMAFMAGKKVTPVPGMVPCPLGHKSFQDMVFKWYRREVQMVWDNMPRISRGLAIKGHADQLRDRVAGAILYGMEIDMGNVDEVLVAVDCLGIPRYLWGKVDGTSSDEVGRQPGGDRGSAACGGGDRDVNPHGG